MALPANIFYQIIHRFACAVCKATRDPELQIDSLTDLMKAQDRIKELETIVSDLSELLALGLDKPSPADIVKQEGIIVNNVTHKITIDVTELNIPFTKPPIILPITYIPASKSMDGLFDYGNNNLYIEPVDKVNHKIMVDWIAKQWLESKGLQTVDAVTRIMVNEGDDPNDFSGDYIKAQRWFAIHRLVEVGIDDKGRYFWFAGVNNLSRDPFICRDRNILWPNLGTVF